MKFASYWHDTSVPFAGAQAGPVSGDCEVAVIGAAFTGPNAARKLRQSEMPIWTFLSEVPAARGPSFDDSAETEQSDWLKNEATLPEAGRLQRTSDRQGVPLRRVLQEKGTVSDPRTKFIKGAARMSRTRLSQPQGAKRRDGQTTAATVRRFCSKGKDAVRDRADPLG
jgi:hypothetical protein